MPLFVIFVFGAVILGAGAMLAPAWPTQQPRVALSAALALAIIDGGAVFYGALVEWDILVVDYLLFTLITGIFLGGTLAVGQARAERKGEEFSDAEQGWPGPQDLSVLFVIALIFIIWLFILPVPFGDDAQEASYLAYAVREGDAFNTLAPHYPELNHLYAPGFGALTAYLSHQLGQPIYIVQFAVGVILAIIVVWMAYDLGAELRNKRLGRALALAMLFGLGVLGMMLNGQFIALQGLVFCMAFIIYAIRYLLHAYPLDALAAGLMLGATVITSPMLTIIALLGYIPWLATMWLGNPRPTRSQWLILALVVPIIALFAVSPWLLDIRKLLSLEFESSFSYSADNLRVLIEYNGIWILPLALLGAWLGWQRRDTVSFLMMGWLFFIVDFSTTGGIARLFPVLNHWIDPQAIAWHGAIIPLTVLGGMGLLWIWEAHLGLRIDGLSYRQTYVLAAALGTLVLLALVFNQRLLAISKNLIDHSAATYATEADLEAMKWLYENSPEDSHILNFPVEGTWVPVVTERVSIYPPLLPFAQNWTEMEREGRRLLAFWQSPADRTHAVLLEEANIDYVIVPQIINQPQVLDSLWRWYPPELEFEMTSTVAQADYLTLVYENEGATVYQVLKER